GDNKLDLVVADYGSSRSVSVLLGSGDGTFQDAQSYAVGSVPNSVAVGDFDGDGHLDLAVAGGSASYGVPGSLSVLLGNGNGTFKDAHDYDLGSLYTSVAVGDFNGD